MRECALHTTAADEGLLSCELESVLYTQQPLTRGCYNVNERVCSTHDSRWWGAVIMWIRECSLHMTTADEGLLSCKWESVLYTRQPLMRGCYHVNERVCSTQDSRWWGAGIMWMRGCPVHTTAADEGLLSCALESVLYTRQPLMRGWYRVNEWGAKWLCFAHSRMPLEAGAACLDVAFSVRHLRRREIPLLPHLPSALCTAMEGGREKPGWCPVLQVRRWEECGHLVGMSSSLESRRSTADQRADGLPLRKCHTHLNAAEEQPWGLPSNERTLTLSCNSLSHNLGSAKWRKRFWRNCCGRRIYTASRASIACFATIGQSFGLAWANRSSGKFGGKEFP